MITIYLRWEIMRPKIENTNKSACMKTKECMCNWSQKQNLLRSVVSQLHQ